MSRARHRVLVDAEIGDEHAAGDVVAFSASGDDAHSVDLLERGEVRRDGANRGLVGNLDNRRVIVTVGKPCRANRQAQRRTKRRLVNLG